MSNFLTLLSSFSIYAKMVLLKRSKSTTLRAGVWVDLGENVSESFSVGADFLPIPDRCFWRLSWGVGGGMSSRGNVS